MLTRSLAIAAMILPAAFAPAQPRNGNRDAIPTLEVTAVLAEPPSPRGSTSEPQREMKFADGAVACITTFPGKGYGADKTPATCVLWIHAGGKTTIPVAFAKSGDLRLLGVLPDGTAWGFNGNRPFIWKGTDATEVPVATPPGRTYVDPRISINVLPSGRVIGTAHCNIKVQLKSGFLFDHKAKPPAFEWLGIREPEFLAPDGNAILSTIFGERPDGSLVGSSFRFKPVAAVSPLSEFDGQWLDESAWTFKDGVYTPLTLGTRKPPKNWFSRPIKILKNGDIILAIPDGIGRFTKSAISTIRLSGLAPESSIVVRDSTDDGRFLALETFTPGTSGRRFWQVSGNTANPITLPSESVMPTKGFQHSIHSILENGAVVLTLGGIQSVGGWSPWIWHNGRVTVPALSNLREDRAVSLLPKEVLRSSRYLAGSYLVQKAGGTRDRELRRAWIYDLQTNREIPVVAPLFPKGTEEETTRVLSVGSNGTAIIYRTGDSLNQKSFVWTPASGLQAMKVSTGEKMIFSNVLAEVHGFLGDSQTHFAATVKGPSTAASSIYIISR